MSRHFRALHDLLVALPPHLSANDVLVVEHIMGHASHELRIGDVFALLSSSSIIIHHHHPSSSIIIHHHHPSSSSSSSSS
jgi:hypothetical protein